MTPSVTGTTSSAEEWLWRSDRLGLPVKFSSWIYRHGLRPRLMWLMGAAQGPTQSLMPNICCLFIVFVPLHVMGNMPSTWATQLCIHEKVCIPNYELLSVSFWPFYFPWEFGQITIILVYVWGPKYEEACSGGNKDSSRHCSQACRKLPGVERHHWKCLYWVAGARNLQF